MLIVGMVVCFVFAEQMALRTTTDAFRRIACTMLTVMYLGVSGAIIMNIRMAYGVPVLVLFMAAVKSTDIGAYFTGSAIGRHKLIPWLSPGKTWEGLFGGMAAAGGIGMLAVWAMDIHIAGLAVPLWRAAIFGVVVGLIGQFGDLSESLLKRSVNVKDSGAVVPEFGGVLDILDSPLLAAPAGYLMLTMC
jgi:phosphatidate cytidylyltransferase